MAHRFKKNNCVFDSDSDEKSFSSGESDSESVESSTDTSPDDDDDDDIESDSTVPDVSPPDTSTNTTTDGNKQFGLDSSPSVIQNESSTIDISSDKAEHSTPADRSRKLSTKAPKMSKLKNTSTSSDKQLKEDYNANEYSKESSFQGRQSIVEESINCEINDVLVVDSSASNDSEIIIDNTGNDTSDGQLKVPFTAQNSSSDRIVEESSDSDNSVECVESFASYNAVNSDTINSLKANKENVNTPEISVINSSQGSHSDKNISKTSTKSNNSLSQSEVSDISQASVHSIDERRTLERQLADKRTAYQNILRAVKFCDPKKLKDGGKLLQEKLEHCKAEVDELKEKLKNLGDAYSDSSMEKHPVKSHTLFSTSDQVTDNLGKKGLETHRVHQALTVDALVTLHNSFETCPPENTQEKDPEGLKVELMPHQRYALAWLLWREKQVPAGGILADDMGLGKTLTMISLVLRSDEYRKQKKVAEDESPFVVDNVKMYHGKTLVVCPSSLIGQWQGQIKQHCKPLVITSLIHHGKPRELQAKKLASYDIVITSYGVVVEENKIIKENKKGALFRVQWKRVIIDEGHVIRNHKTKTAQALCEIQAKFRWCLTGTPVQNKELDMYSLLKFLHCSPFDNLTVWKRWVDNKSANGVKRLNTIVKSILLRRTKEELKTLGELNELPAKTLVPVYVKLDEDEETVYHTVLKFSKSLLADFILQEQKKLGYVTDELKSRQHKLLNSANEIKTTEIFVLLLRLRQICCLPGLIHSMLEKDSCAEDGIDIEEDPILQDLTSQMKRMSVVASNPVPDDNEKREKVLIKSNPVFQIDRASVKIRTVVDIVKESLEANDKIVVVSQWSSLLQRLKTHIVPLKTGVVILDGSVPVKFRPKIIDDFNDPKSNVNVMLLSLTAGGVGLNLMGGNRLVIFEPHWNPQLESQACDRIYRVGQKKLVYIYKIICKNTIEERIELLQKKKLEVANTVLKGELKFNRNKITLADLKILFDVHEK